ncbi:MAG: helix-hairpin-helix domain-containing protein [Thermoleophilia bacterium]
MGITRKQLYVYVALAFVVTAFGVRYLIAGRAQAAGSSGQLIAASPLPASSSSSALAGDAAASASPRVAPIVVYVCGAVVHPGVYDVQSGARVADLLKRAGGAGVKADLAAINLAARLSDGQQVVVPKKGEAAVTSPSVTGSSAAATGSAAGGKPPAAPVNLNTATVAELDGLSGIGPATAQKIIDYRTANGAFKAIAELKNVSGIGDAKFAALKPYITVQ